MTSCQYQFEIILCCWKTPVPNTLPVETAEKWVSVVRRKSNHNEMCGGVFI